MRLLATTALTLCLAASTRAQTPASGDIVPKLSQYLDSLAARDEFSGVVMLAQHGKVVFQHAYGFADRAARKPNTLETAFNLGSINKIFTSTSVRQLVAAGKIDLDATIAQYLPDYPNPDVARKVTIRQLLDMQAGLGGDIFGVPAAGRRHDIRKLADFLPLFADQRLRFEPGSRRQYCNACFVVLGLVIERVSGQSYYDYVRDHIYAPAGLTHTAHYRADALPPFVAIGYTRGDEAAPAGAPLLPNTELLPGIGSSAGGGYSTAADLLQFLAALRAQQVPNGPLPGIGIAGGAGGINAVLEGELPGGYDVAVMTNLDPPAAERVGRFIRELLGARD
ncbi:MAG TPA: serine hydrolase domain-containing protein [Longimicrobiales bacterium]